MVSMKLFHLGTFSVGHSASRDLTEGCPVHPSPDSGSGRSPFLRPGLEGGETEKKGRRLLSLRVPGGRGLEHLEEIRQETRSGAQSEEGTVAAAGTHPGWGWFPRVVPPPRNSPSS